LARTGPPDWSHSIVQSGARTRSSSLIAENKIKLTPTAVNNTTHGSSAGCGRIWVLETAKECLPWHAGALDRWTWPSVPSMSNCTQRRGPLRNVVRSSECWNHSVRLLCSVLSKYALYPRGLLQPAKQ
jgi:hypothetical protein